MLELDELIDRLSQVQANEDSILILTGAGISAESGIRTFRGPEGYWREESPVYRPEELATWSFFQSEPALSWTWYLHRRHECRKAQPNAAHAAVLDLNTLLHGRVDLVTQNVDGLHRRSGFPSSSLMEIHGNLDFVRCSAACSEPIWQVPEDFNDLVPHFEADATTLEALACPGCGALGRPHVLWFDEYYNETHFKLMSAQAAARRAALLIVVGTTGTTNLPQRLAEIAIERGIPLVDINIEANLFRDYAATHPGNFVLDGLASHWLPGLVQRVAAR